MGLIQKMAPFVVPDLPLIELDLTVKISVPGGWLYLEDEENGYTLHSDTRKDQQISHRTQSTDNIWAEGSYVTAAVRGDVTETVAVWVAGGTPFEFKARMDVLSAAFEQLAYQIMWRVGDSAEYWNCKVANYTISTQREYMHATTGFLSAQVPRHPQVLSGLATVDDS